MNDHRIFRLSWHYTAVIFPLTLSFASIATYEWINDVIVLNINHHRAIACILGSLYLWYKCLTVPFKIEVTASQEVIARSLLKRTRISTADVEKIKPRHFSTIVYSKGGKIQITNLMNNFQQLISIISSGNPNLIIDRNT